MYYWNVIDSFYNTGSAELVYKNAKNSPSADDQISGMANNKTALSHISKFTKLYVPYLSNSA